jgi:two-component system nitrogen regulation response regulator GlnG
LAATNKNLDILVEKNLFRQDLFYRLNVITVKLPKLKERKEDIGLLAQYFLKKYSYMKDREIIIGDEVVTKLKIYNWPGNIRELENTILYAIINSDSNVINVNNLPAKIFEAEKKQGKGNSLHKELYNLAMQYFEETPLTLDSFIPYDEYIKMVEVPLIEAALSFCSGNKSKAAEILGINRNTLRKKIEEYGVK